MGTFQRLRRWLRLRGGLFRDPDTELARRCEELETRLLRGQAEVSACESEVRRLAALTSDAEWLSSRMLAFARRALYLGHEDWAREVVERHLQAARQARMYARHWRCRRDDAARLRQVVETLETHLAEIEYQRHSLSSRRYLAQIRRLLLKGLHGEEMRVAVEMAEERALAEEYTADAYAQLITDPWSAEIDALPDSRNMNQVEDMLFRLKEEMQSTSNES